MAVYASGTNKAEAKCPTGYVATGGGGSNPGLGGEAGHYTMSGPINSEHKTPATGNGEYTTAPTGWFFEIDLNSASTTVYAYVICSK